MRAWQIATVVTGGKGVCTKQVEILLETISAVVVYKFAISPHTQPLVAGGVR